MAEIFIYILDTIFKIYRYKQEKWKLGELELGTGN